MVSLLDANPRTINSIEQQGKRHRWKKEAEHLSAEKEVDGQERNARALAPRDALPTTHSSIRRTAASDWTRIKLVPGSVHGTELHGQHRDQPPIAHVHGSRNPITRFLRCSSPRDARRPLSAHVRGTGPPRYAAFVPLNQHVPVARAPVAGNRIRVFRPIFQPPLLRENRVHCFANRTNKIEFHNLIALR